MRSVSAHGDTHRLRDGSVLLRLVAAASLVVALAGCGHDETPGPSRAPQALTEITRAANRVGVSCVHPNFETRPGDVPTPTATQVRARRADLGVVLAAFRRMPDKRLLFDDSDDPKGMSIRQLLAGQLPGLRKGPCDGFAERVAAALK
jgi:hypothetical protein